MYGRLVRGLPSWDVKVVDGVWVLSTDLGRDVLLDAVDILQAMKEALGGFMKRSPTRPVRIYLLGGEDDLSFFHENMYGRELHTPFGFYEDENRIIGVNASEGWGPLAHEVTHPFIDADFRHAPPWIDEGLASLYEASEDDDNGERYGFHNRRLLDAKELIERPGQILRPLMQLNAEEFYEPPHEMKYASARYFWLWLQEMGELPELYKALRSSGPSGDHVRVVERFFDADIEDIETSWRHWVLSL